MFDFSTSEESEQEKYSKLKRNVKEIISKATRGTIGEDIVNNTLKKRPAKKKIDHSGDLLKQITDLEEYKQKMVDSLLNKTERTEKHSKKFIEKKIQSSDSDSSVSYEKLRAVRAPTRNRLVSREKKENYQAKTGKGNVRKDGKYSSFSDESEQVVESQAESVGSECTVSNSGSNSQSENFSEGSDYGTSRVPSPKFFDMKNELCTEIRRKGKIKASSRSSSEAEQTLEVTKYNKDRREHGQSMKSISDSSDDSSRTSHCGTYLYEKCHPENNPVTADCQVLQGNGSSETESLKTILTMLRKEINVNESRSEQKDGKLTIQCEPASKSTTETNLNATKETIDKTENVSVVEIFKDKSTEANGVFVNRSSSEDLKNKFPFCNQSDDELIRQTVQELEERDREENLKTEGCTPMQTAYPEETDISLGGDGDNCSDFNAMLLERIDRLQEEMMALRRELEEAKQYNEREARDVSYMSNLLQGYKRSQEIGSLTGGLQWDEWELKEMVRERMREKREAAALEYQTRLKAVEALCTVELGNLEQALEALVPLDWKASSWGSPVRQPSREPFAIHQGNNYVGSSWMAQDYFLEVVTSMNLSTSDQKISSSGGTISANRELPPSVEPKKEIQ